MLPKIIPRKLLVISTALPILLFVVSQSPGQNQNQKSPQNENQRETPKQQAERNRKEQERIEDAQNKIQHILLETKTILNPVIRIRIRMLVGDAHWSFRPDKAREILSEEFPKIALIALPTNESEFGQTWTAKTADTPETYKGVAIEQVKAQLRREILSIISAHDPALARALIATEKKSQDQSTGTTENRDEVLASAAELTHTNPEAAASIIRDSLRDGVGDLLPFILARLRETSPVEASAIFNQVLLELRSKRDVWEFEHLVPYILPTEMDRLLGGRHYLSDSQRMKDAKATIEYAAELLYHRLQTEDPSSMTPELVKREYYLWRNLQEVFSDLQPDNMWLVNLRLRQLTAVMPPTKQGSAQGPWSEERLNKLIAAADASSGDKRDEYLDAAAFNTWRFGQGDLDKAIFLAEKIGNEERRDSATGTLYFRAGLKFLRSEGPDYALNLAKKITLPVLRMRLYLAIIAALNSVRASDRADLLREELLVWLRNHEKTPDTARAIVEYLERSVKDDPERNLVTLEALVGVLNVVNFKAPDRILRQKIYWYPELHDFRKSLNVLAKADFDKGIDNIRMLANKEIRMQIEASFYGNYLRTQKQNKKPSANQVSKSDE